MTVATATSKTKTTASLRPEPLWKMQWFTFARIGYIPGAHDHAGILECQRDLNAERVKKILREWNERRAKPPFVGIIAGKSTKILDGQHTCAARIQLGQEGVWALASPFDTEEEAVQLFRWYNTDGVRLSNFEDWKAGRWMGDEMVLKADAAVEAAGFTIAHYSSARTVACIWHVKDMMSKPNGGAAHLQEVVTIADLAWHDQPWVFRGEVLAAIGQVLRKYGDKVDRTKAVRSWGKDFTPTKLVHTAKERHLNEGSKHENTISSLLVRSHDRRLSDAKKLRPDIEEEF